MSIESQSSTTEEIESSRQGHRVRPVGEMADRIRDFDWTSTQLGAIETWSETLLSAVNMILSSPLPMQLFWGPDYVTLYNDALTPLLTNKHPAALGTPAAICWHEAWGIVGPQLERVRTSGEPVQFERSLVPIERDGIVQDVYWDYVYSAILGPDGAVEGILDIAQDVTAAVVAQHNLAASEARANRVLQSIGDAVVVTDPENKVSLMNPVAELLTGWSQQEAVGLPLTDIFNIVNESTREPIESPADKVKRHGAIVGLANHTVLLNRGGGETHIDDSGAPITDDNGQLTGIVLVFRDIEERRKAEVARDRLTSQLEQTLEGTTDGVAMVDRNWRYTYFNPAGRRIANAPENVVGQNIWEAFPGMVFEGSPYVFHQERGMYEGIAGEFTSDYPQLNLTIQVFVRPIPDGIVTIFRDITQQKRSTAALIQTEKLAAVGRLASSIAHEINNPLEAVTNLLFLLRGDQNTQAEREQYLEAAEQELRRVSNITNQTLRFHKQSNKATNIQIDELVSGSLSVYQGRLAHSGVQVERRDRVTKTVESFDGEIRQVLINLIGNAIDAMHAGGRLLIRSREATCLKTSRTGVTVTIADTGPGISAEVQKKIFEPFFTTKGTGGTGLGLWVSAEIIDRHQGKLMLRSSRGSEKSGTVFTLFLPYNVSPKPFVES